MSASLQERIRRGLARQREAAEGEEPIPRRASEGAARLSFAQQRIWFLQRLAPQASTYNIARAFEIDGRLDAAALERALVRLADRHEVLRTALHEVDGRGLQTIAAAVEAPLPRVDLSALGDAAPEAERLRLADLGRPFDVERSPLWRASLVVLAPRRHLLLLNLHHAIFDAWSMGILFDELSALYGEEAGGGAADLDELPVQYADYAEWQRERLDGERLDGLVDWWRGHLDGAPDVVELAADRPRPSFPSFRGDRSRQPLPADLAAAVRNPTQRSTTPFMVGLAAFVALVGRFTGGDDLVIGTPVAGRTHSRLEGLIGFFVSTLALRFDLSGDPTFEELLAQVRDTVLTAQDHAEAPFEVLVERLSPQRRLSHTPLFQALFTVRGEAPRFSLAGVEVTAIERRKVPAQFDLSMALVDEDDRLLAELTTSRDLFDPASGERLLACYRTLLAAALAEPQRRLSELPLLDAGARHRVVEELNRTRRPYPRDASLPELVSGFARRQPERVALTWIDGALADGAVRTMTYGELDAASDRLARRLVASGVGRGDAVAVCVPRSPRMVAAILAVLKAGGFYVPLDAAYPVERLEFMLRDSGARLLVEVSAETPDLPAGEIARLDLGADEGEAGWQLADAPGVELPTLGADDLAYVMYTSGSTGTPKGVEIVHRNVVRLVCGDFADTGCDETWPHFAPAAFDASTIELWSPLANGGRLALAPPGPLSVDEMVTVIGRLGVTSAFLTAGLFHQMVENRLPALVGLRQLLSGGDVLSPSLVRQAIDGLPGTAVVNCYGPTENGVVSSRQRVNPDDLVGEVPIGEPIANSTAYVVDAALRPQPVGVPGELVVGGDGVGRGYRGRPALTARHFVPDPFGPPGSRLYRTGDQARWLSGGNLEFLGRRDDQVKIRGFRIELGEVRQALETLPGVAACTVVARAPEPSSGSRDKVLVGYVVAAGDATLDLDALRTLLARRLPAHLMPAHLVPLDRLPLDAHGKVDRKKLPAPSAIDRHRDDDYVAPRGRIEEQVVEIWSDLLPEAGRIGVEDDFFHLGGHSLLANRVAARLRQVFGVELPLRTLFEAPTPAAVASAVEMAIGEATPPPPPLTPADRSAPLPASFGQERLWFLAGLDPASTAYNVPCAWDLAGDVDETALAVALGDLVRRHESLRTRLVGAGSEGEAGPVQVIEPPAAEGEPFALERVDLSGLAGGERAAALDCASRAFAGRRLDLAAGPLFAAVSFDLGRGEDGVRRRRLALLFHHAIFDGASLAVFERDLAVAYAARRRGVAPRLPELA
ncbi:MAG TPA: amino acid adenylation domain-containing protein, partial [Thermoanaerobaculia bacterium]|nr:amino acid adenylation domain-containing protein [Thermoanaerobaculia bacterium]